MPPKKYPKVPEAKISSLDIVSFDNGLDQRGDANIRSNSFSVGRNAMVTSQGLVTHRLAKRRWLPDAEERAGAVFPALVNGNIHYIIADAGKIKYMTSGALSWTVCGGDNTVTTADTMTTFLRVQNKVLILNGEDTLGYVDLSNMEVVHYNFVANPATKPTTTLTGITTGNYKAYYCISYNSVVGKTASTPIQTQAMNKIREQWKADGSEGITITDPNTRPAGAVSWNVYLTTAPTGSAPAYSDMLPIALGLDITTTTFFDNGQITPLTNAGTAPDKNSTEGPKAKYGVEIEGRPFLYGIKDDEYAVLIGGDAQNALDFNEGNGGYRLVLNEGTNYYPQSVIGFRNGQGLPSITVLFSNTEGLSKQSIIEQSTVSLGTFSAVVWGSKEQNYGAAGVSSPYAVVNYKGKMIFPTTDGVLSLDTQASLQNVLLPERISDPIVEEVSSIRTDLLNNIVGTAWANRVMMAIPARGFTYNNKIIVYDTTRRDGECWYVFDIEAQWIGTVSPPGSSGFVYISQGKHFYRLDESYVAQDETAEGLTEPFPVEITTALIGSNTAHDGFFAIVQVMFYLRQFIGSVDLIVRWRDYQSGKMKTKVKRVTNGEYAKSSKGNWSSSGYLFNQNLPTDVLTWGDIDELDDSQSVQKADLRFRVPLDIVTNELQATIAVNLDNSSMIARSISFQGKNLGIAPDVK